MAVKYKIQYKSVNNDDYVCDISNPSYLGIPIELDGSVEYGMNAVDTLDNPIRAKYLTITVTATLDRDLEELLTQGERYWRVELYRNGNKIFFGYLTSEQSPQSFVSDSWDLTFDALDPMAFLEDLAYVDNTGSEYNGDERLGRVVANCLKRGFEDSNEEFNILAYIPYDFRIKTGVSPSTWTEYDSGLFMTSVTLSQDGFIDQDSDEVKSCLEVLTDVLKSLQLTITQINGDKWLITHYLYDTSSLESKYVEWYDSDWINIPAGTKPSAFNAIEIKTDSVDNDITDIIHINQNQQYYFNYALGKKVIDHKYEYKSSLLDNFELDGGTAGVSIPSWDIDTTYAYPDNNGTFRVYRPTDSSPESLIIAESLTTLYCVSGQQLKIQISAETNDPSIFGIRYQVEIENDFTGDIYKLGLGADPSNNITLQWFAVASFPPSLKFPEDDNDDIVLDQEILMEQVLPPIPNGNRFTIKVQIRPSGFYSGATVNTSLYATIHSVDIVPNNQDITGTSTVAQRTDEKGFKSDKEETYLNTGNDTITHNTLRHEFSSQLPIDQIKDRSYNDAVWSDLSDMKSRNLLIANKLKRFFIGDFWNFFEPHNIVNIPDLTGNDFKVLEYSFQTKENVGTIKVEEVETSPLSISITKTNIYANTIKPTIK